MGDRGSKDSYGSPDIWTSSPATVKAWLTLTLTLTLIELGPATVKAWAEELLKDRKVTAQAAGCRFVEETLHTFTRRADGHHLLPIVNTLIRNGGVMPEVIQLAKWGKTSKIRHECLRALTGFPQHPSVYQA